MSQFRVFLLAMLSMVLGDPRTHSRTQADSEFRKQYLNAQRSPNETDFAALRAAFAKTSFYRPDLPSGLDLQPIDQELSNGEREAARVTLDRLLSGHEVDALAHAQASEICDRIELHARAEMHLALARGLLKSILDSGDGRDFRTAFVVIDDREEQLVLRRLGVVNPRKSARQQEGHQFHVYTVDRATGSETFLVHFQSDEAGAWNLEHHAGKPPQEVQR